MSCDPITTVSRILNDNDGSDNSFIRWSKGDLECYQIEANVLIASVWPETASSTTDIDVVAGALQTVPEDCGQIVKIIGLVEEHGGVDTVLTEGDNDLSKWFNICNDSMYSISGFDLTVGSAYNFTLSPPVPLGFVGKLRVLCINTDTDIDESDPKVQSAVIEWMLYRALLLEDDSPTSAASASLHLQTFFTILQISQAAQQNFIDGTGGFNVANNQN